MSDIPDIAPAPWQLTGHGYLFLLRCPRRFSDACADGLPGLEGHGRGGLGALMLIDYASSNVGPYRELLLVPGRFAVGGREAAAVTHIWVSTERSVVNGRRNWGLPKASARFEMDADQQRYSVTRGTGGPVRLAFSSRGPALPMSTAVLPKRWHTLLQPWKDKLYETRLRATGRLRMARLEDLDIPPDSGFPDVSRYLAGPGFAASRIKLEFPTAQIGRLPSDSRLATEAGKRRRN